MAQSTRRRRPAATCVAAFRYPFASYAGLTLAALEQFE